METNKQETLSDIAKNISSQNWNKNLCPWRNYEGECTHCPLEEFSFDRLSKRNDAVSNQKFVEVATSAATEAVKLTNENHDTTLGGNAAAMREALEELKSEAEHGYEVFDYPVAGAPGERGIDNYVKADYIIDMAKSALAIPLRQCDVGTDKEQYARFNKYCNARHKSDNPNPCGRAARSSNPCAKCYSMWVLMPYEAEEGAGVK